jgi:hypothetical protein
MLLCYKRGLGILLKKEKKEREKKEKEDKCPTQNKEI